jgi:hypothetical protein
VLLVTLCAAQFNHPFYGIMDWYFFCYFQVINDKFGIVEGLMTTVHAMTGKALASF